MTKDIIPNRGFKLRFNSELDKLNITPHAFSNKIGVNSKTIYLAQNGHPPGSAILHKCAKAFSVSMEWLLVGEEPSQGDPHLSGVRGRLEEFIDNEYGGDPEMLAAATGISPQALTQFIEKKSILGGADLVRLAAAVPSRIGWILTGTEPKRSAEDEALDAEDRRMLKEIRKMVGRQSEELDGMKTTQKTMGETLDNVVADVAKLKGQQKDSKEQK